MSAPREIRPYTSYNLFFQLEREYIIQTLHGYQPTIAFKDLFNPADEKYYPAKAPPLPSRYANLMLPFDWHIPGKTQRRKRSHRKTHGKIGFHQLNAQISKAWSTVDGEIKIFCECLSKIESRKYKKVKRKKPEEQVAEKRKKDKRTAIQATKNEINTHCPSFDWSAYSPVFVRDDFEAGSPMHKRNVKLSSKTYCRRVSCESQPTRIASLRGSIGEVDMEDNEIFDIWKATPLEDKHATYSSISASTSNTCQVYTEIVNPKSGAIAIREETHDNTRKSFIDAEYEMFKDLGQQLVLTRQRLPSKLARRKITPCQA